MLRPSHRVQDGRHLLHVAVFTDGGEQVSGFEELVFGNARDALDHLRRVTRVLLLQQLEDAAWVLQRQVVSDLLRHERHRRRNLRGAGGGILLQGNRFRGGHDSTLAAHVTTLSIVPSIPVVGLRGGIESSVKAVLREFEPLAYDERSAGVIEQIIFGHAVVLDGVVDDSAQKRDVRSGANLAEQIGIRGGAREARIHHDHLRIAGALGFNRPLEAARVVLGGVSAHDQHHVGVLDVDPAIRHGPASKCWSQT